MEPMPDKKIEKMALVLQENNTFYVVEALLLVFMGFSLFLTAGETRKFWILVVILLMFGMIVRHCFIISKISSLFK